jgi:hypothetical protein
MSEDKDDPNLVLHIVAYEMVVDWFNQDIPLIEQLLRSRLDVAERLAGYRKVQSSPMVISLAHWQITLQKYLDTYHPDLLHETLKEMRPIWDVVQQTKKE